MIVYLPPGSPPSTLDITNLLEQVPKPVLLIGDMNAHHPLWGSSKISSRGKVLEAVIEEYNLTVLNNGDDTFVCHATGIGSSIDIALCSEEITGLLDFDILQDTYSSDHLPIVINLPETHQHHLVRTKWRIEDADWELYRDNVQFQHHGCTVSQITEITRMK